MKIFSTKKNKKDIGVLKLFKSVDIVESKKFSMLKTVESFLPLYLSLTKAEILNISINYDNKSWKNYNSFKEFILKNPQYSIADFSVSFTENMNSINIENTLINKQNISKNTLSLIEIIMTFSSHLLDIKFIKEIISIIQKKQKIDYGYALLLSEDYDIYTENKLKKGLFSSSSIITKNDIDEYYKLNEINKGYMKFLYTYNVLNEYQLHNNNIYSFIDIGIGKLIDIDDRLKILELNDIEIKAIKQGIG